MAFKCQNQETNKSISENTMMKISIITPSYNQGRFIQKCIDSVKSQQGVEVEHIILDNCSTDQTVDLLNKYRNDPQGVDVKIIIEPDKGQTAAINRGFLMVTGHVVCWLNTDEYYEPGALSQVAAYFEHHPEVDVVFGDCYFVDTHGGLVKRKREFSFNQSMLLYYGCYIPSCATFIRRRVIDAGHLLDQSFRVTMDFEYYVRLACLGYRFQHIPDFLVNFTWHETNISSTQLARRLLERRMVQDRYSGIPEPALLRTLIYEFMRYSWIGVRILRRSIHRIM